MGKKRTTRKQPIGSSAAEPKYGGRTVEEWFADIRAGKTTCPKAIGAFREDKLSSQARAAIPLLIDALSDQKQYGGFNVRYLAAYALGRMGKAAAPAIPQLMELANHDKESDDDAVEALGKIDPKACGVPFWIAMLKNKKNVVVRVSAKALAKIGPDASQAIRPLVAAAKANVLGGIAQNHAQCIGALVKIAPDDPRVLKLVANSFPSADNKVLIRAMLEIGTDEAIDELRHVFQHFDDCCFSGAYGHQLNQLLDKVEAEFDEFQFLCPNCQQPLGTGANRQYPHC